MYIPRSVISNEIIDYFRGETLYTRDMFSWAMQPFVNLNSSIPYNVVGRPIRVPDKT